MLQWHARITPGQSAETWDDGRWLERWAEPAALAALPATFAGYAPADQWRALFASLDLFTRLAHETAARLGAPYPTTEPDILQWLHTLQPL